MKYNLLILALVVILGSCENEDYLLESVGFTDVYFPKAELPRSAVAGEGLFIKVGVNLGGIRNNDMDRTVQFAINESLLDGTTYTLLPSTYYELSNPNEIIIPKGEFLGMVTVKFDSLQMANDNNLQNFHYAIPFSIESAPSVDSILFGQNIMIVPIKIMNTYEGIYYCNGTISTAADGTIEEYGDSLDWPNTPRRALSSVMMDSIIIDGIANRGGDDYGMMLKVNSQDNIEVLPLASSLFQAEPNGACSWDPERRKFQLRYKYQSEGTEYLVEETYTFRNRNRDGIEEWRWPGFEGN